MFHFLLGSILGSFFCVLAERWPLRINFWSDRSRCPHCQRILAPYELIPLVSYLWLKGRCRTCHKPIAFSYFLCELILGLLFFLIGSPSFSPSSFSSISLFIWVSTAFILSVTDYFYLALDAWLLYLAGSLLWGYLLITNHQFSWLILGSFLFVYFIGKKSTAIGEGDLLIFLIWFPWLTWYQIYGLLFVASGSGILYFLWYRYIKKERLVRLPFVPFLSLGLFISFYLI